MAFPKVTEEWQVLWYQKKPRVGAKNKIRQTHKKLLDEYIEQLIEKRDMQRDDAIEKVDELFFEALLKYNPDVLRMPKKNRIRTEKAHESSHNSYLTVYNPLFEVYIKKYLKKRLG